MFRSVFMRNGTDHYKALGVPRSASADEIKRAYRRLAKKHHPDRNPDDSTAAAKFKEVQRAYEVLSDPDKRTEYDQFGEAGVGQWSTNARGQEVYQWGSGSTIRIDEVEDLLSAFGGSGHASVFDQLFGGAGRKRQTRAPQRGADVEQPVSLSLERAGGGTTVTVRCPTHKSGNVQTLEVKIPAGVEDGQKIRLKGRGRPGSHGGPPGDLLLTCSIQPHPYFSRLGSDLYVEVPVNLSEAALGARIEVPSLDGFAMVTLPPGTPSGTKLRLAGRGFIKRGGPGRGDQYVMIRIVPPPNLSEQQKELFQRLKDTNDDNPRRQCPWWRQ